jgi:hypothetical protein
MLADAHSCDDADKQYHADYEEYEENSLHVIDLRAHIFHGNIQQNIIHPLFDKAAAMWAGYHRMYLGWPSIC